ncbi:hypothetical protein [Oerskovia enterophila]|uniref:Uncharacterized protein n=1 Tax=Oerskovia enterophila TaxID=43678 RepID=A0ABX2Y8C8_9CELL|nr:hypothetical protein [Oerskovia enterophila]OCI32860.1 hypothetical protein OERS_04520 [Oerskovia enterophila]
MSNQGGIDDLFPSAPRPPKRPKRRAPQVKLVLHTEEIMGEESPGPSAWVGPIPGVRSTTPAPRRGRSRVRRALLSLARRSPDTDPAAPAPVPAPPAPASLGEDLAATVLTEGEAWAASARPHFPAPVFTPVPVADVPAPGPDLERETGPFAAARGDLVAGTLVRRLVPAVVAVLALVLAASMLGLERPVWIVTLAALALGALAWLAPASPRGWLLIAGLTVAALGVLWVPALVMPVLIVAAAVHVVARDGRA